MNRNRLSLIVALIAMAAVLSGAWFLGAQPQLAQANDNSSQQADIDATNAGNRAELLRLQKASKTLDQTEAELDSLRTSVPATPSTASLVAQFDGAASASGVTVTSVTIGDPKAYEPVAPAADAGDTEPSASATPGADAPPSAPELYTDASVTPSNFVLIPVTVAVQGSYDQALSFTKAVQAGERLFLVTGVAATASDTEGASPMDDQSWSLSGSVYVLADPASDAPAKG